MVDYIITSAIKHWFVHLFLPIPQEANQDYAFQLHYPHPQVFGDTSPDLCHPRKGFLGSLALALHSFPAGSGSGGCPGPEPELPQFERCFPLTSGSMQRNAAESSHDCFVRFPLTAGRGGAKVLWRRSTATEEDRRRGKTCADLPQRFGGFGDALSFFSGRVWRTDEELFESRPAGGGGPDSPSCASLVLGGRPRGQPPRHRLCGPGGLT